MAATSGRSWRSNLTTTVSVSGGLAPRGIIGHSFDDVDIPLV